MSESIPVNGGDDNHEANADGQGWTEATPLDLHWFPRVKRMTEFEVCDSPSPSTPPLPPHPLPPPLRD